jgi:hypothetical protein
MGMQYVTPQSRPDFWLSQMFSSKAAQKGAVIRRSIHWVEREVGQERFFDEVERRGYHLIRTADQFVVICHDGPVHILF